MPVLIKTSGGVPVSDYDSLQNSYNNLNSEYNSYKSSHSHTNDEYNSYGESQYNSGYGNGVNAGKSSVASSQRVVYSRISREDTNGWKNNVLSVGGLSSSATYMILYGCYISGNWGCDCTCSAGSDGMGRNDGNAKTYFKKATGITSVSINFHPNHSVDSMCYLEVIQLM